MVNGDTTTLSSSQLSESIVATKLQQGIERMIKPRAYPLFLLEKGLEVIESIAIDTSQALNDIGIVIANNDTTTTTSNVVQNMEYTS
jgi:hypothetical protein